MCVSHWGLSTKIMTKTSPLALPTNNALVTQPTASSLQKQQNTPLSSWRSYGCGQNRPVGQSRVWFVACPLLTPGHVVDPLCSAGALETTVCNQRSLKAVTGRQQGFPCFPLHQRNAGGELNPLRAALKYEAVTRRL